MILQKTLFAFFLLIFAVGAYAQSAEQCVAIVDPDERLNCFDQAYQEIGGVADVPQSQWLLRTETSALDDTTSVFLNVFSEENLRSRFGRGGPARLTVRCVENTTSVILHFGGLFMADSGTYGQVAYRVDDAPAGSIQMSESTNNEALGLWRGGQAIPFIRQQLFGGESLFVRATPFSESPVEMRFDISGLEEVIAPLREACNW